MTPRYEDAYNVITREQARVAERALTMILDDEQRARQDAVLLALDQMRMRLQERGAVIAPHEVLSILQEVTGFDVTGQRLPVLLANARKREEARRGIDARKILEEATRTIEAHVRPRNRPTPQPPSTNQPL